MTKDDLKFLANLLGRQLIAAANKDKNKGYVAPRTFSDEYPWARKPQPSAPIPEEARRNWEVCWGRANDSAF